MIESTLKTLINNQNDYLKNLIEKNMDKKVNELQAQQSES